MDRTSVVFYNCITNIIIARNVFENVGCKMEVILSRRQYVINGFTGAGEVTSGC